MEELDVEGLFWLVDQPDDKVAGRLRFDVANGAELSLIGAFHQLPSSGTHDLTDVFFPRDDPVRLLGVAGKRLLTLERCIQVGTRTEWPGMVRERYSPEVILSGAHFEESESLEFSGVRFELSHLDEWVSKSSTSVSRLADAAGKHTGEIQIDHKPREETSVLIDVGELALGYIYSYKLDSITEKTIGQRSYFRVKFREPRSLDDVLREGTSLQNLVTIGVAALSSFTNITLSHLDKARTFPSGRVVSDPVDMYAQFRGGNISGKAETIHPTQMLFTFDDIGGLDGIAKWLETSAKFRPVIDSLLSHWYLPMIYTDNRLLNMIIAAEALERIKLQKQNLDYSDALKSLAKVAGAPFSAMVQDVDAWVEEIVRARTNNLVHRGLQGDLEGQRMYTLSESLYFLVVICLLRESGIPEVTLSKMQSHQIFSRLAKQLQSSP